MLDSRVCLERLLLWIFVHARICRIVWRPLVPIIAHVEERLIPTETKSGGPFGLVLNYLRGQSHGCVKRYVAMHNPDTGIICFECYDQVAVIWEEGNISPKGVVKFQYRLVDVAGVIVIGDALVQDGKIMTVQVDWVLSGNEEARHLGQWMWLRWVLRTL